MEALVLRGQLRTALTAHELWRSHLASAVLTGRSKLSPAEARRVDLCDFGRWLARAGDLPEVPQVARLRQLHATFHEQAAAVLELATTGKRERALKAIGADSPFDQAANALTAALNDWMAAV
jgi:hypothetical protein